MTSLLHFKSIMGNERVSFDIIIPGIRYNIFKSCVSGLKGAILYKKTPYFESSLLNSNELNDMICLLDFFGFDSNMLSMTLVNTK